MKKAFVLVLALVLTMGLAVPAAAATSSPKAATASPSATAPLPTVVGSDVKVLAATDSALTADEKTALASAQAVLADATPAGMKAQYFFYVQAEGTVSLTVKVSAADLVVKQFVDGKWVELKTTVNADGTVTIEGVVAGAMAIFTK